jgi:hypothetical protein
VPTPTREPTPTRTPTPERTPAPTGPGSRGGQITIRDVKPATIDTERWIQIKELVYSPAVEAAIAKQARGERLDEEERRELNAANAVMASEVRRAERKEPMYPDLVPGTPPAADATATPGPLEEITNAAASATVVPGTPTLEATPDLGPPAAGAGPYAPGVPLEVIDQSGKRMTMTPEEFYGIPEWLRNTMTVVGPDPATAAQTASPSSAALDPVYGGESGSVLGTPPGLPPPAEAVPPPTPEQAPIVPPLTPAQLAAASPGSEDALLGQAKKDAAARAAAAPKAPPPRREPLTPSYPGEGSGGRPGAPTTKPAPSVKPPPDLSPPKPAEPPPPPRPPFADDPEGATLAPSRFTRAIARAGGKPTQKVAERAAGEIRDVFRPGDQGGWRGDTGGWRTLAQRAAEAWEEQFKADPNSLRPSEREAYRADPKALYRTILDANSPFADYRESYIGAVRAGQLGVPGGAEFAEELRPYGAAPTGYVPPSAGISQTTDQGGVPRVKTPSGLPGSLSAPPEPGPPVEAGPDLSGDGSLVGDLTTAPEPERVVPLPGEEVLPEADAAVIILGTPDLSIPESADQMIEPEIDQGIVAYADEGAYDQGSYDQGEYAGSDYSLDDLYASEEPVYEYDEGGGGYESEGDTYAYDEPSYEYSEYVEEYA